MYDLDADLREPPPEGGKVFIVYSECEVVHLSLIVFLLALEESYPDHIAYSHVGAVNMEPALFGFGNRA